MMLRLWQVGESIKASRVTQVLWNNPEPTLMCDKERYALPKLVSAEVFLMLLHDTF